ncbi:MAG: DUF58 domain-containing protein [Deltaproteobacteria bacterium]|nr:DUF58 domain-containing protein [Deltaproteobacteria bacterium]
MNLRPVITVPLPWLIILFGKLSGKKRGSGKPRRSIFRLPRSLSITREGKWFIGILLFIGIAAINTGNNLLYLIVATLLSFIVISGILSESTIKAVRIRRAAPKRAFKGAPTPVRLIVSRLKGVFPSFSLRIKELDTDGVSSEPSFFLKLDPKEEVARTTNYIFNKRGVVSLSGFKIATRFPFGLFLKGKEQLTDDEILVYPSIKIKAKLNTSPLHSASGDIITRLKGQGTEIYSLREYMFEDDSRHIHWRSAAKASKLLVKEFARESERKAFIVFNNFNPGKEAIFEDAVDEAASTANLLINKGYSVGLKTLSSEIAPGHGGGQLGKILHALALISPVDAKGSPSVKTYVS